MQKKLIKPFKKENIWLNVSLGMYIGILVLTTLGAIILFGNLNPYFDKDNQGVAHLKFFTCDSNLIMGMCSIVAIIFISLFKSRRIKTIDKSIYIIVLVGTTGVSLTMFVTLFFLVPLSGVVREEFFTPFVLLTGSNLIYHILNPVAAIVAFCFFKTKDIKLKETLYSLIPVLIYSIFYMCMALTHIDPTTGKPEKWFDWYWFCQFGWIPVPFIMIAIYGFTFMFSWLLWLGNRKLFKNKKAR